MPQLRGERLALPDNFRQISGSVQGTLKGIMKLMLLRLELILHTDACLGTLLPSRQFPMLTIYKPSPRAINLPRDFGASHAQQDPVQ
jgi:hypothetical protein